MSAARMLSDVIAADQDTVATTAATSNYGTNTYGMHHQATVAPSYNSPEAFYSATYHNTGAGDWTMTIMMGFIFFGYAALGLALFHACCTRPRANEPVGNTGYVRFVPYDAESQMMKSTVVAELEPMWRKAFIAKVYTLLAVQILITIVISYGLMQFGGYNFYVWSLTDGAWTRMASFVASIVLIISMFCYKSRYPMNLVLLLAFTVVMSYTIGCVTAAYAAAGMQLIVIEALGITSLIFVALTIFTMKSKMDFSFLGLVIPIVLLTVMVWGLFSLLAFQSFVTTQVYALIGTLIFSLYVVYDTWMIINVLSYDDYVLGAVNLYLDFINLFLCILQMLAGGRRD